MVQKQPSIPRSWWSKMVIYWLDNQVALNFHSSLPITAGRQAIINSLGLDEINQYLNMRGYNLVAFGSEDVPFVPTAVDGAIASTGYNQLNVSEQTEAGQAREPLNSLIGKYLFQPVHGTGTLVICFFHLEQTSVYSTAGASILGLSGAVSVPYGSGAYSPNDPTRYVINLINNESSIIRRELDGRALINASPNWLCGGTPIEGCGTHGCTIAPPIPVTEAAQNWHFSLPELAPGLQQRTGAGVTVFVLDTRPPVQQILTTAQQAGEQNQLLQTLVTQLQAPEPTFVLHDTEHFLPRHLENGAPMQPFTGRDVFGRLGGFEMSDHGLFVAGIIRDLVPEARIECLRVLNDFGVGTVAVLVQALERIHHRMLAVNPDTGEAGDLYQQPVVINLSLVTLPHQEVLVPFWSGGAYTGAVQQTNETASLTLGLQAAIQSLTASGAIVVGSAGNDSDARSGNSSGERMQPRYPAAFPEVLSVGAVDKSGHAASYSNYPVTPGALQNNGIATYGGGVPIPVLPTQPRPEIPYSEGSPFDPQTMIDVERQTLDAIVGLHTAPTYPAFSTTETPQSYAAPNPNAWAYWSGTSFATPVISAVAARLLEDLRATNSALQPYQWHHEVMSFFTRPQAQAARVKDGETFSSVPEFSTGGINVGLLKAQQSLLKN
ncbi:S8 family peptidase [Tengunoibacter tsumagoiensis]|uniref:Peptidase S8/S53 domain-containing protein n=1 Tax=Tengunoibacter tsumagoiensis TaxID=2014871 RepID=A0A402A4P9_9CHLR|nr:S8 family serine peptidase [Tengunoibacter tsumagoiensis]GCE14036.1 hypothetical protein KTT_38950 [Tengunoibacter tsumagoiensis]